MRAKVGSALVDADLAERAFLEAGHDLEAALARSERPGPNFVSLVLLNPIPQDEEVDDILLHGVVGPSPVRDMWKYDYRAIAKSKATISRRLRMDTALALREAPALLQIGDTFFQGGVHIQGLSCGVSGVESHLDEEMARIYLSKLAIMVRQRLKEMEQTDECFLP